MTLLVTSGLHAQPTAPPVSEIAGAAASVIASVAQAATAVSNSPLYDMDFAAGDALNGDFTFTRATSAWRRTSAGLWESVGSGVLRYHHDAAGAPLGILIEEPRTSRALHCRDLTQAAWTKTGCTVAKNAAGIDGSANSASTLTATGANATCLQALTLASAERVFQPWVRRKTGSGTVEITMDGGASWHAVAVTSAWQQFNRVQTLADPSVGVRIATSGDEIEADFAELQDGARPLSPIETTTAEVTRAGDAINGPNYPAEWTVFAELVGSTGAAPRLFGGDWFSTALDLSGLKAAMYNQASTLATANTFTAGSVIRAAARVSAAPARGVVLDGGAVATDLQGSDMTGRPIQLGRHSVGGGGDYLNSTIASVKIWHRPLDDIEMIVETT